ncbi:MAG: hypothetical protein ACHQ9S_23950 [Candidatus Binatia bacterium]
MSAEQLIALEAALTELSTLYTVARGFAALRLRAEEDLLPRLLELGSKLRGLLRAAQLSEDAIERAAQEIVRLRSSWHSELDQLHTSPVYQEARAAWDADRQEDLARLVPLIFAGVVIVRPAPALFFPVSASTGRRRPGSSPFLRAAECADRIVQLLSAGIEPEDLGAEWWERELRHVACAGDPAALDTPIALKLAAPNARITVFGSADEPMFRIFTSRLRAAMSVVLAAEAADEWWQAYEESYESFCEALRSELATRGVSA